MTSAARVRVCALPHKVTDWFDTQWILRKKNKAQLSFPHAYHHATIGMIWGHLLRHSVGCSTIRYGVWANSLTHVFMYSHYLWKSFGLKNPFKRYVTLWEICQLWSCLAHAVLVCALETTRSASSVGCQWRTR